MILAAGKGTRMLPLTEIMPKALLSIQGITLLEHTISYLKYYGIKDIIINVHHFADQIIEFVKKKDYFKINIAFSEENEELLDTGGGLYKARWFFGNDPFILIACDVITTLNLNNIYNYHIKYQPLVTLAVKHRPSTREFILDSNDRIIGWVNNVTGEKIMVRPATVFDQIAFSTVHIIDPAIFDLFTETGAFSITKAYLRLAGDYKILGYRHDESHWFECGRIDNLENLNNNYEIENIFKKFNT